jgi:hypothetical protein
VVIGVVRHARTFALGCGIARPDDMLRCFLARGAEIRPGGAWISRRRPGPVLRRELIAADILFATGSFAAFPGMPGKADDTWSVLER